MMWRACLVLLVGLSAFSVAHAEGTPTSLLALAPEDSRILGYCNVERLREAEFLPVEQFDRMLRRVYAEHLLGQTAGEPPALPCRRVVAGAIAAPRASTGGMLFLRCEGLDRDRLARDLERAKEVTRLESPDAPGVKIYHRKVPPAAPVEGLIAMLRVTFPQPREVWIAALDDSTLILSTRDVRDLVQVARQKARPVALPRGEQLRQALAHLDPESDLAGLAVAGEVIPHQVSWVVPNQLKGLFQPLDHLAVQVRGSDPLRARVSTCTQKASQADELRGCLEQQLALWKKRSDVWKWILAGYGVGRLTGALESLPEPVQESGELTQVGMDILRRVEVRQDRALVEVRLKIEAREMETLLRIIRPHLPAAN